MAITLEHITNAANQRIAQILKPITSSFRLAGIAVILPRRSQDRTDFLPLVINDKGEASYIGPEDRYDIQTYHRVLQITPQVSTSNFGRKNTRQILRVQMTLVVFLNIRKTRQLPHNISVLLTEGIPSRLALPDGLEVTLNGLQINTNSLQVFQEEFNGSQSYFLHPDQAMFRINYIMEGNIDTDCLNSCLNDINLQPCQ